MMYLQESSSRPCCSIYAQFFQNIFRYQWFYESKNILALKISWKLSLVKWSMITRQGIDENLPSPDCFRQVGYEPQATLTSKTSPPQNHSLPFHPPKSQGLCQNLYLAQCGWWWKHSYNPNGREYYNKVNLGHPFSGVS